ncbi:hypothetical protein OG625_40370 (plasmid) [Streptomyces sp. NBC_01351]|uniref:hypothetical protein n=1 Tax=Streptomyces sp. NBC_01351 TaxID=2903833 RepID=UPI002E3810B8|nr:hypothetical protein [Streptomyces sp. NBC_01351]
MSFTRRIGTTAAITAVLAAAGLTGTAHAEELTPDSSTITVDAYDPSEVILLNAPLSSGWDYVGASTFRYRDTNLGEWFTGYVYSTGGNFLACVSSRTSYHKYSLWERDDTGSRRISTVTSKGGCLTFKGLDAYVDGANNKAEFMLSTNDPQGGYSVTYYD